MRTFRCRALTLAVLFATSSGLAVVVAPPAAFAAPTLTVSATTGLTDKHQVIVNGSGFTPSLKQIAVGQCVAGFKGPTDCNLAGGAAFVNADGSGKLPTVTLKLAQKFGAFDCTKQECVVAAQILPNSGNADQVEANKVSVALTFGKKPAQKPSPATPPTSAAPSATPAATTSPSTSPAVAAGTSAPSLVNANPVSAGPDRYAVTVLVGSGLLLLCIGLLVLMPYRNRRST
ncbi:neocarzinostatin apoprotein domain-containing protein [Micromonospora sp. NBC_00858]|uniref:neocarzinostatin apoprotein domain-containing protein n=1 Tax=Micromonospora sp. NBC_00858 TaxID=2975979 RepID=UPI0038687DFB|nr:neocarzinostatin apoprotein domain-containing protein [Micromonospora sp. NBC_00858]